jgi:hypothetical protein
LDENESEKKRQIDFPPNISLDGGWQSPMVEKAE